MLGHQQLDPNSTRLSTRGTRHKTRDTRRTGPERPAKSLPDPEPRILRCPSDGVPTSAVAAPSRMNRRPGMRGASRA